MFLIFDTETTGLPKNFKAPLTDFDNWPRMVQLAWQLHDNTGKLLQSNSIIIKPVDFEIPEASIKIHGISNQKAVTDGEDLKSTLQYFTGSVNIANFICGHNVNFDLNIVSAECLRIQVPKPFGNKKFIDTKNELTTNFCNIPGGAGWDRPRWPSLSQLHEKLFGVNFTGAHNAAFDVEATAKVLFETIKRGIITVDGVDASLINYQAPDLSHLLTQTINT